MKMRNFAAISLITLFGASQAVAEEGGSTAEQSSVPARFAGGLDAASAKIRFPDYERDVTVYINCAASLNALGEVERYFCLDYYGVADTRFRERAEEFIETVEISPALVNGEPKCGSVAGISRVEVGTDGKAVGDVDLMMSYGAINHYGPCENWMMQTVRDGRYIPAHHEGKPVAAMYVELGGDPEWFTLKKPDGL